MIINCLLSILCIFLIPSIQTQNKYYRYQILQNVPTNIIDCKVSYYLCYFGTANKYVGRFDYFLCKPNVASYIDFNAKDRVLCNKKCQFNDNCYATTFDNKSCSFYNTSLFNCDSQFPIQTSIWIQCNSSVICQPKDQRCPGLWITYTDEVNEIDQYQALLNVSTDISNCRNRCLQNPLCGFVNRRSNHCLLISKWPAQNLKKKKLIHWETDEWTCAEDYINQLEPQNDTRKPIYEKCTGYWKIIDRNKTLTKDQSKVLNFQTQTYLNCLKECDLYSYCSTAWFSLDYSMCILKDIETSDKHLLFDNMTFIEFEWICVENDSHYQPLNEDEKRYKKLGMNCYTIVNNNNLFIAKDECGHFPNQTKFKLCREISPKPIPIWQIVDSCLIGQSYWAFSPIKVYLNIKGVMVLNAIKVYTGLQAYWIAFFDRDISETSFFQCRYFNASRPLEILKESDIIPKEQWFAQSPKGTLNKFKTPPNKFIITASQVPFHSCRTKAACIDILRTLQVIYFHGSGITPKFSDIPYNFMIDDYGNIYECRGWKNACGAVYPYNYESICIGYIGWFALKYPNERYLNAVKKLIEFGAVNHHVVTNYSVYIHPDIASSKIHRNLEIVIKNLYRYRYFIPTDCRNISRLIILLNCLPVVIVISLFYSVYLLLGFKKACKTCQILQVRHRDFCQIYPSISVDMGYCQLLESTHKTSDRNYLLYERFSLFRSKIVSKTVKLVKLWFFNQFLQSINDYRRNELQHFLSEFLHNEKCTFVYEMELDATSNVVIVLSDAKCARLLLHLMSNGYCLCLYFTLEKIQFSPLAIDIDCVQ